MSSLFAVKLFCFTVFYFMEVLLMVYVLLACIAILALGLLWSAKLLKDPRALVLSVVLTAAAFLLRALCMDHVTLDYVNFLSRWVQFFRDHGGFAALDQSIGNYNIPYLYFLAAFSYSGMYDLHLIKLLSILTDVLCAYYAMLTVGLFWENKWVKLASFFAVLFLPTVVLNGAYWGQCDSVYTLFIVMALYYMLREKPVSSVLCVAVAFAFKLQAIFFMPIYFVLLFTKRVKLWHLFLFPAMYLVLMIPAVIIGRPIIETITLYIDQGNTVGSGLNYNSPSIYAALPFNDGDPGADKLGIILAFGFVFIMFAALFIFRRRINNRVLLITSCLFVIGIPFFLPHMHDRYFFMADVLTLIAAFVIWKILPPVTVLTSYASLLGYNAYLRGYYYHPMRYGTAALVVSMMLLFVALYSVMFPAQIKGDPLSSDAEDSDIDSDDGNEENSAYQPQ